MRERGHIKRPPRIDTRIDTVVIDSDGNRISVVVIDMSRDGCRMETSAMLRIGEKVQIEVPKHGTFSAQIRWALGNEAGAVFLEPVFVD